MWWCSRTIAAIATPEVTCASRNSSIKTILACGWRFSHLKRVYNDHIALVERLEESGAVLLVCPQKPLVVDRMCTRTEQLEALYHEGYDCARQLFAQPHAQRFLIGE